jgi:hypothetical protein
MSDPLAAEIAALRARAAPPDPLAEIAALRARIARIEAAALAAAVPTEGAPNMENAIRDRFNQPPPDREQARRQSLADRFVPDPQLEATIAARSKDPAAYDREMARVGAYQGMELAIYGRSRDAAIALKTWTPDATKEGSK